MNPKVDFYFTKAAQAEKWGEELAQLRMIILDCHLNEELKWGCPCYTYSTGSSGRAVGKRNIVLIHTFKDYCALLFFKGALLKDPKGILIQQTKNVQSARQIRFTSVNEIMKLKPLIKKYIYEAVEVEEAGLKVTYKKPEEFKVSAEFQHKLDEKPRLKTAFYKLTPGRQRGYLLYFSAPKQSKTRESRVEKSMKQILDGKGLYD